MVRRPHLNAAVVLTALSLCHCASTTPGEGSSSTSGSTGSNTAGSTGSSSTGASSTGGAIGTSSSGSHGSTGASSSASSSSSGGTTGSYRGIVSFSLVSAPQPVGDRQTIAAGFGDSQATLQLDLQDCTGGEQSGACCYRTTAGNGGSNGSSGSGAPQAGDIAASDGSTALGTLTPDPSNGRYSTITNQTWAAGDTLSVAAPGDVVGAFSGQVTAPTAVTITAPTGAPPLNLAQVSTAHALVVTWTGVGGTHVYTTLTALGGGASGTIICTSDDTGRVTIPSTLVAHFTGAFGGVLLVARSVESKLPSSNTDVTLSAATAVGMGVQFTQ